MAYVFKRQAFFCKSEKIDNLKNPDCVVDYEHNDKPISLIGLRSPPEREPLPNEDPNSKDINNDGLREGNCRS